MCDHRRNESTLDASFPQKFEKTGYADKRDDDKAESIQHNLLKEHASS
jgi:hypothetical protein